MKDYIKLLLLEINYFAALTGTKLNKDIVRYTKRSLKQAFLRGYQDGLEYKLK